MKKRGKVVFEKKVYDYEVDEDKYVWIIEGGTRTNIGQHRPLLPSDDVEEVVLAMLQAGGY
jgi:hypothetical protein